MPRRSPAAPRDVLDIKSARRFHEDACEARSLGRLCQTVGAACDRKVSCVTRPWISRLAWPSQPLEVEEAGCAQRYRPDDVREVTLALAGTLLELSISVATATKAAACGGGLADGRAAAQFERWCFVQGGSWKP